MKILFVDDEQGILDQAKLFLERKNDNFEVITTSTVSDGLKILGDNNIDVLVSDYQMPENDGLDFLRKIQREKYEISFIMFTGKGREEVDMEALNLGADRYLQKGGDPKIQYMVLSNAIKDEVKHKKAEKAKLESERRFRMFTEKAPVAILIAKNNKWIYANPKAEEISGYDSKELKDMQIWDLIHPEDKKIAVERDKISLKRPYLKIIDKQGNIKWIDFWSEPIDYEGDSAILITAVDITDRKKTEEKLKSSRYKIKKLHDVSSKMETTDDKDKILELALDAAKKILEFQVCSIEIVKDNEFVTEKSLSEIDIEDELRRPIKEGGIDKKTFINQKSYLIKDLNIFSEAKPVPSDAGYKSALSLPIGKHGVFQAISTLKDFFSDDDLELSGLLVDHLTKALDRLDREREVKRRKDKIKELHEVALKMKSADTEEEIYEITVDAADKIIELDMCEIQIEEDGYLVVKERSDKIPEGADISISIDNGIAGKTFRKSRIYLNNFSFFFPFKAYDSDGISNVFKNFLEPLFTLV